MNILRKATITVLGVATVAALALGGATAASADPSNTPADRPLRGVGSDTTQDLYNGISQVVLDGAGKKYISSWNATGTSPFKTWSGGTQFNRPDGSGAGLTALRSAVDGSTTVRNGTTPVVLNHDDVNFARSSSGGAWLAGGVSGSYGPGRFTYLPYAADAVTWATKTGSTLPTTIPVGTTANDGTSVLTLRNIYSGRITTYTAGGTTITLHPLLPQSGSGTRSYFVNTVLGGIALGTNVQDSVGGVNVQENDGGALLDGSYIVPFSIGSWIAQSNASQINTAYGSGITDRRATVQLGQVDANAPVSAGVLNSAFPIKRVVFTIVETAAITPSNALFNAKLASTFVGAGADAYTANSPYSGKKVYQDFGFAALPLTVGSDVYTTGDTKFTIN